MTNSLQGVRGYKVPTKIKDTTPQRRLLLPEELRRRVEEVKAGKSPKQRRA